MVIVLYLSIFGHRPFLLFIRWLEQSVRRVIFSDISPNFFSELLLLSLSYFIPILISGRVPVISIWVPLTMNGICISFSKWLRFYLFSLFPWARYFSCGHLKLRKVLPCRVFSLPLVFSSVFPFMKQNH